MARRIGARITSHFGAQRGAANLGGEPAFGPACPPAEQSLVIKNVKLFLRQPLETIVREPICRVCTNQVRCGPDAYFSPIVDAVEESTGKTFDRAEVRDFTHLVPGVG